MSKIPVDFNNQVIDDNYNKSLEYCVPRPEKIIIIHIRPKTPWEYSRSLWAIWEYAYEGESEVKNYNLGKL